MNADDPVLHQQLAHITQNGRKATNAESFIVCASFWDDTKDANAVLAMFDCSDEIIDRHQLAKAVETMARGLNNLLVQTSTLQVILRDSKTGSEMEVGKETFGHYVAEVDRG